MSNRLEDDMEIDSLSLDGDEPFKNSSLNYNVFLLKEIKINGVTRTILLQNQLGSCALIALVNVLLIRQQVELPQVVNGKISIFEIERLLENYVQDVLETKRSNQQNLVFNPSTIQATINALLSKNVMIDPIFTTSTHFVNSMERDLFAMLDISLYHAWLPNKPETISLVGNSSYSQLQQELVNLRYFGLDEDLPRMEKLDLFLNSITLTENGLQEICETMTHGEVGVFLFDHIFCTVYKHGDKVFQLVTESNYMNFRDVVWETIDNFGTSIFFDEAFRPVEIDLEEAQLVVEDMSTGFISTTVTIPVGTSTKKLKDEIFKKIETASQTTLEFNGNSLTITGTHNNVELTTLIVEVIALNLNPLVPDPSLKFIQPNMGNETAKKLVNQWKQLYILIHKRQDLERIELSACQTMANYLGEFTGINLNKRMCKPIRELWLSMNENEQSLWYSEKMRRRQIKLEKQSVVDLQIRNLNRKISETSKNLSVEESNTVYHYLTVDKPKKRVAKHYCQYRDCKKKFKDSYNLLRHERNCNNNVFKMGYPCESCHITTFTEDGLKTHMARFHPDLPVSELPHFEKEAGETMSLPLSVELCQTVVFKIPHYIRASVALKCEFTKFMEYVNKEVNNTFRFRDVTSINGIQMTGNTATETRNLFQEAVIHAGPKWEHISVVLQRISVVNDECLESNMTNDPSISPSETLRESPSCATALVCVQPAQKVDGNEGPPRPKAPKMTESVKGKVVFWKGHDPNLTVLLMLKHATRFGRIANILLHKKTEDGVSSLMEFETAESAKKFVASDAYRFKISTRYNTIITKDQKILDEISDFYRKTQ